MANNISLQITFILPKQKPVSYIATERLVVDAKYKSDRYLLFFYRDDLFLFLLKDTLS